MTTTTIQQNSQRLYSIDALRGLIILIMLLDHVREAFYYHQQPSDPMNIQSIDPALFFIRSLTHLCAPIFILLTGLSAYLYQSKIQSLSATRHFLYKRGLFLIILEISIINFSWFFDFPPHVIYLQVIWAIGLSMISLALLTYLPIKWIGLLSLIIIFSHNLFDQLSFDSPALQTLWNALHQRGWLELSSEFKLRFSYPVLPWIGVIGLGYCLGQLTFHRFSDLQDHEQNHRIKLLFKIGCASLVLFFILRIINIYGDKPRQLFEQYDLSIMSFFNLTKYPPSLDFILWTCGIGLILFTIFHYQQHRSWIKILVTFGSVPMFFYILHLYVIKIFYFMALAYFGKNHGEYFAFDHIYMIWIFSIFLACLLYPITLLFSQFKHRNKHIRILKYF